MKARKLGKYSVLYDDGTSWPRVGTDLSHRARYDSANPPGLLMLASFVDAFEALVWLPRRRRDEVIAALRAYAGSEGSE